MYIVNGLPKAQTKFIWMYIMSLAYKKKYWLVEERRPEEKFEPMP